MKENGHIQMVMNVYYLCALGMDNERDWLYICVRDLDMSLRFAIAIFTLKHGVDIYCLDGTIHVCVSW